MRVGFIPLNDAAPLLVAQALGLFSRHGLKVELSREVGWATIRDKIIHRELDAAHAPGAMVLSTTLGLGCQPCECLTALILNTQGNCITLSNELHDLGVRDAETFRAEVVRSRGVRTYVLGTVFEHSSHRILLTDWLRGAGIDPERDVRIVVVPPPQLFRNLVAGTVDGYCAGEPWNSLAVRERMGWCPALSMNLAPGHPEKVLMVRSDFANRRPEEHLALVAALSEAARLCDEPAFREELPALLARREYLNVPARIISAGLSGSFDQGHGRAVPAADFIRFHRLESGDPKPSKASWLLQGMARQRLLPPGTQLPADLGSRCFRSDLFHLTQSISRTTTSHEKEPVLAR